MTTTRRAYICECTDRRCRERIRLQPSRYLELSRFGAVVSPYCTGGRRVIYIEPHVRVVESRVPAT